MICMRTGRDGFRYRKRVRRPLAGARGGCVPTTTDVHEKWRRGKTPFPVTKRFSGPSRGWTRKVIPHQNELYRVIVVILLPIRQQYNYNAIVMAVAFIIIAFGENSELHSTPVRYNILVPVFWMSYDFPPPPTDNGKKKK